MVVIACDSCGIVNYLDLRMKPRDPEASIRGRCAMCAAPAAMVRAGRIIGLTTVAALK